MNEVLFDLKNPIFDVTYNHHINQCHTNHSTYHITRWQHSTHTHQKMHDHSHFTSTRTKSTLPEFAKTRHRHHNRNLQYFNILIFNTLILWHVDPLLGNVCEVSSYTTAAARQWLSSDHVGIPTDVNAPTELQQRNGFSTWFVPRCYKQDR
jgi:hypothetical protein